MYNQIAQPGHRTRPTIGGRLYADHEPDECEARNHTGIRVAGPQSSHEGIGQGSSLRPVAQRHGSRAARIEAIARACDDGMGQEKRCAQGLVIRSG